MATLIDVAKTLTYSSIGNKHQSYLRRAVSTVYYALFHALADNCATCFVGARPSLANFNSKKAQAWLRVYRSLEHGIAKKACEDMMRNREPEPFDERVSKFGAVFIMMQTERHRADYDPSASFEQSEVVAHIEAAEAAIVDFQAAPKPDRKLFAASVLLKTRR